MTAKMSQDAKKEEFRKYLEKAGILELLTKSLVQLYEVKHFFYHVGIINLTSNFRSLINPVMRCLI